MKALRTIAIIGFVTAVLLSACRGTAVPPTPAGPPSTPSPTPAGTRATAPRGEVVLPAVDPSQYSGTIIAAGSSTVYPLAERMTELFLDEGFAGTITIDSIGTGAGFERFCIKGETDISTASRRIKESERQSCHAIGRDPIEFQVGIDALVIVVSRENTFVQSLTLDEVRRIFTTADKWSDVNPAWPAKPIKRFIPGTDSGTFDFFVEAVLNNDKTPLLLAERLQMSEDDNVLAQGVMGGPYSIGFFGFAFYQENMQKLRAVAIEGVTPDAETAESGEYPLSRPLFLYSDATVMRAKPQVAAFLNFFLTYVDEEIMEVGYFPVSPAALDAAKKKWLEAMGL
ncbi:MAG: PstS family phosphate ABC transporter substrate-binding protein [Anaerolineae bacterium]